MNKTFNVFSLGLAVGFTVALLIGYCAERNRIGQPTNRLDALRIDIVRLQAEVDVDSKCSWNRDGWMGISDVRTRAGNLAVLKERLRQLEASDGKAGQ